MHPLLLMITSSSSLQYAEYPKYNGWSFRTTLKIEKKNRFKWKLHVELIDVAWSTNNSMNFKLAQRSDRVNRKGVMRVNKIFYSILYTLLPDCDLYQSKLHNREIAQVTDYFF